MPKTKEEKFFELVRDMRQAQKRQEKYHDPFSLEDKRKLEAKVDEMIEGPKRNIKPPTLFDDIIEDQSPLL